jgi:hypothetical protein
MNPVRRAAFESVARATGFFGLLIACMLVGLSWNPPLAAKTGGVLCLVATLTMMAKARHAPTRDYRQTETWILLSKAERPPADVAQRLTGAALQEAYHAFAIRTAIASIGLFAIAILLTAILPPGMTMLH